MKSVTPTKHTNVVASFRETTINAGMWSFVGLAGRTLIGTIVFAILAHPIGPELFGLVGMVLVVSRFAVVFLEAGFPTALIQKADAEERHFSSVFWLNIGMGATMTITLAACSPLVASFYGKPELVSLTCFLSSIFIFVSFSLVQKAKITKALNLRLIALSELVATLIAGIVAIVLAYSGFGVWSIAIQSVVFVASSSLILWCYSSWLPKPIFDPKAIKELLGFSANFLTTNTINYWVRNLDKLLIGKFLGDSMLGLYGRAYQLMLLPMRNLTQATSRVLFPAFSKIQGEHERIRSIFLQACRVISLISLPLMFGLCAVAPHLISAVLGEKWMEMVPVLRVLCFVGAVQSVSQMVAVLYLSQGRTDLQLRVTFLLRLLAIISIVIGLQWGIVGIASCYLLAVLFNQFPNIYFAGGLVGLTFREYACNLVPTLLASAVMLIVVLGLAWVVDSRVPDWLATAMEIALGIAVYSGIVVAFRVRAVIELFGLLKERGINIPILGILIK